METTKPITECSLDTNVLLRWIIGDDVKHLKLVQDLIEKPSIKKIHLADVVIAEMVWVMQSLYKLDRTEIVEAIEILLNSPKFVLNKSLFAKVVEIYPNKKSLSFVNLMLVFYTQLNQSEPLVTFDTKLSKNFSSILLLKN